MKKWIACFCLLGICFLLWGCRRIATREAVELLRDCMTKVDGLPVGEVYRSDAAEGENGYFPKQMMLRLYGEEADTRFFPLVEEYAVYLSTVAEPCEIAVFRCYATSDTDRLAEMCLARIEALRIALVGSPYRARADAATVCVEGRTVIMQLLS